MTTIDYLNLSAAIFIVAALAGVCRLAFLLAGDRQRPLAPAFAEPGDGGLTRAEDAAA